MKLGQLGVMQKMESMKKILVTLIAIGLLGCNANTPVKENLGYQGQNPEGESVEEVLLRLESDPNVDVRNERGWKVAAIESGRILYSFTPENHPAHPSYVKREVVEKNGTIYIETNARCGAKKSICDQLVRDFIELNNKVKNIMQGNGA